MSLTLLFLLVGAFMPSYALDWGSEDTLIQLMENHAQAQGEAKAQPAGIAPIDAIIDFLLSGTVPHVLSNGNSSLHLPNFSKEFTFKEGSIQITVGVNLQGGLISDVKSLYRAAPTVVRRAPAGVSLLEMTVGMRQAHVQFERYTAHLDDEKLSGTLKADLSPVAVRVQVLLQPPCHARLRSLSITSLGPLHVSATGLGPLSGLPKLIEDLFAQPRLRAKLEEAVLRLVTHIVQQELDKVACK